MVFSLLRASSPTRALQVASGLFRLAFILVGSGSMFSSQPSTKTIPQPVVRLSGPTSHLPIDSAVLLDDFIKRPGTQFVTNPGLFGSPGDHIWGKVGVYLLVHPLLVFRRALAHPARDAPARQSLFLGGKRVILAITLPVAPDFTIQRGKVHAKDLRDFHHREPKLAGGSGIACVVEG